MKVTIQFTDVYDGKEHVRVQEIDVAAPPRHTGPESDDDLDAWSDDVILPHTGDGNAISKKAGYFAEIVACDEYPSLVGREFEWL
jgi:hypothetical protein